MPTIELLRGSDGTFVLTFQGIDLSGKDVELFDVAAALQGGMTAQISDPGAGLVTLKLSGAALLPPGRYRFRLRVFQPGARPDGYFALPPIEIEVQ